MYFEYLATLCAGMFAGAAVYVTFVEHPARMECGTDVALAEFGPSYRLGAVMQASLATLGLVAAVVAWLQRPEWPVLAGGLLLGSAIPFTLLVILPTNKRLLAPTLDRRSVEALTLLHRWGRLHAVRTGLSVLSFGMLLWQLATR